MGGHVERVRAKRETSGGGKEEGEAWSRTTRPPRRLVQRPRPDPERRELFLFCIRMGREKWREDLKERNVREPVVV